MRKNGYRDPRAQEINEGWIRNAFDVSLEVLDKIGVLWITGILGSDENTARLFRKDDTNDEIGLKHAGVVDYVANSHRFWTEVNKIAPELARTEDLGFLIENDDNGTAAWAMICALDGINPRMDSLTTRLVGNALLYK